MRLSMYQAQHQARQAVKSHEPLLFPNSFTIPFIVHLNILIILTINQV